MEVGKLVRKDVIGILTKKAKTSEREIKITATKLKGKEFKHELCSLFLTEYKQTLVKEKPQQLTVHYAEMLEVIRTLMVKSKTDIKKVNFKQNQSLEWYKKNSPDKAKLNNARIDLLQKFDEFLALKTEAVRDQLIDIIQSFKDLVESHNIPFVNVEKFRRKVYEKFGVYEGDYLGKISFIKRKTVSQTL